MLGAMGDRRIVTFRDVVAVRAHIRDIVTKNHGTGRVLVFGSPAREVATSLSGLDLLVEFRSTASYFDLIAMEIELSELLEVPVDVISLGADGRTADRALSTAIPLC
ncbi:nucleotidyltransferase domain-containing protein [Brachybacterium muris]|uniref:nucleotidyltransferase family protein n=1 Tax=Brachybacterium muris TaxID=219301 RepID=UPI0021A305E7|nr:nucleotidyltransferase domain-containing protein [Brachybacterium muris]MCT1996753.1 nucleotidyltransferase domain-containing protein [Brachybacterium muris]